MSSSWQQTTSTAKDSSSSWGQQQPQSALELNKNKTSLVVIDLQKGVVQMQGQPHAANAVVSNAAKLAEAFRNNNMPVFLVHVVMGSPAASLRPTVDQAPWSSSGQPPPKDWTDIVPELGPKEGDILISKRQWGAFYGTELDLQLRRRGQDTLVLCGIATNIAVESTARFAYEYGYNQVFVEDGMTGIFSPDAHNNSLATFRRIGRVRSTQNVLDALK